MKKEHIISGLFAACCLCNANTSVHAVLKDNLHGVSQKNADKPRLYVVKVPRGGKHSNLAKSRCVREAADCACG